MHRLAAPAPSPVPVPAAGPAGAYAGEGEPQSPGDRALAHLHALEDALHQLAAPLHSPLRSV